MCYLVLLFQLLDVQVGVVVFQPGDISHLRHKNGAVSQG